MKSVFAYLFDNNSDGHVHITHDYFKIIFINILNTISINVGTPNDPNQIKLTNDLTIQEKVHNIINKVQRSLCLVLQG